MVAPAVTDIVHHPRKRRDWRLEAIFHKIPEIAHHPQIVLYFFLTVEGVEGSEKFLRNLLLSILLLVFVLIALVELDMDRVLTVVQNGTETSGEREMGSEFLLFGKLLEKIELAHHSQ